MSRVVHVFVGSSAAASFRQTEIASDRNDIFVLRDPLSCGPLLPIADVRSWTERRKAYWGELLGVAVGDEENLYSNPQALGTSDEIVLWLGTDLADQIALAWLPAFLRALDVPTPELRMVQFERNQRGVEILGLGMLSPEQIAAHPPPRALTGVALAELDVVWHALTAPEPAELVGCLRAASVELPFLSRALRESLPRYPDSACGLNAWEVGIVRSVSKVGPKAAHVIGDVLIGAYERLRAGIGGRDMVGDGWLSERMVRLADPKLPEPALEITGSRTGYHDSEVRLTPFGQRILAGEANFVDVNGIDDWVFGVHLQSDEGRVWFHRDGELIRR